VDNLGAAVHSNFSESSGKFPPVIYSPDIMRVSERIRFSSGLTGGKRGESL
jgi:hypothetical protein